MPELDYALLCDYARAEGGVAHVIAAGIDTIHRPEVPSVANLGLLARIVFADEERGETHEVEVRLRDQEGEQIAQVNLSGVPRRIEGSPRGLADRRAVGHELSECHCRALGCTRSQFCWTTLRRRH
jgi:hypothetical protein